MRIITWNINKRSAGSAIWEVFDELNPDIALLQEVGPIPKNIKDKYNVIQKLAVKKDGRDQKFSTAILVRGTILKDLSLTSEFPWVNTKLEHYKGNIVAAVVKPDNGPEMNVISVHSPHWSVDTGGLTEAGINAIRLKENPKVWVTELVWAALKNAKLNQSYWVVGGDYNSSETFDPKWQDEHGVTKGLRTGGNREILDRMTDLEFTECLRPHASDDITPTYKSLKGGGITHQMDHLFVTKELATSLKDCRVGDNLGVFEKSMSDHLPIIADFREK